jgi:hypothetical protein
MELVAAPRANAANSRREMPPSMSFVLALFSLWFILRRLPHATLYESLGTVSRLSRLHHAFSPRQAHHSGLAALAATAAGALRE